MTLLIAVIAAIICTVKWYNRKDNSMVLGPLCIMYWGASLMWLGDAIWEYSELQAEYFTPAPVDMLNDAFLGLSVVALGLVLWLIILLVKDPKGRFHAAARMKESDPKEEIAQKIVKD